MKINKWLVTIIGLVISAVFLYFAFRDLKPDAVVSHLQSVDWRWILVASTLYILVVALISLRWQFMLRSIQPVPLRSLMMLVSIGYMGNNVYPFRSGEILRTMLLQHHHHIPFAKGVTTVVVERILDGLIMLSFVVVPLLFIDMASPVVRQVATFSAPIFVGAMAVFLVLAARPDWMRWLLRIVCRFLPVKLEQIVTHLGEEVIAGLEGLRTPLDLLGAVLCTYASWMVEASIYWTVSFAFGLNLSYPQVILVTGVVNLAGLIPAAPGQIGVFELAVKSVVLAYGVAEPQAQAYALVVHVILWLPVTVAGFIFLAREGLGWSAITRARELEQQAAS